MKYFVFLISSLLLINCSNLNTKKPPEKDSSLKIEEVITDDYHLLIPKEQKALLVLFPCMPCNAENTLAEFNIKSIAEENGITLLLMNFNQRLWLTDKEKASLEQIILQAVNENQLDASNVHIGGFSSGGNVSLLLSDYLKAKNSTIQPKGVFIVDSPIDLLALKESALQTIERNFSPPAVAEANWILDMCAKDFGEGDLTNVLYEIRSPFSSLTRSDANISHLSDMKIRLYTEPDTAWWYENKRANYENMNAYYIEMLAEDLKQLHGNESVELIQTENRGYRANGMRHPHSWSVVDEEELVKWVFK